MGRPSIRRLSTEYAPPSGTGQLPIEPARLADGLEVGSPRRPSPDRAPVRFAPAAGIGGKRFPRAPVDGRRLRLGTIVAGAALKSRKDGGATPRTTMRDATAVGRAARGGASRRGG